jgi:hypothetical protein
MSSWTKTSFHSVFYFTTLLAFYDNYSEKSAGGENPLTWGFAGGLKNIAVKAMLSSFLFAYLSANLHLHLIKFLPFYCLLFLIPVGIVVRSIFPLRRFGGAMMGAGIALIVLFPFLLLMDSFMVGAYFGEPSLLNMTCTGPLECASKVCKKFTNIQEWACAPPLVAGESCDKTIGDWQCASGKCIQNRTNPSNWICADTASLKTEGQLCSSDKECVPPLWCNAPSASSKCLKPLADISNNPPCSSDSVCGAPGSAYCDKSNQCQSTNMVGETCTENKECGSLYCLSGNCTEVKTDQNQVAFDIAKAGTQGGPGIFEKINPSTVVRSILDPLMIAIIGGIALPLVNYMLLSRAVKDFSGFFGAEIDISSIYKIL